MHKPEGWPQHLIMEECSFKNSGELYKEQIQLMSVHHEPSRREVFRKWAATVALQISINSWTRDNIRRVLPELKRKNKWTAAQWSIALVQMKGLFAFHLEIKVPESVERAERHRILPVWSPVWIFHCLWWFGVTCELTVVVVLVGPLCFIKSKV